MNDYINPRVRMWQVQEAIRIVFRRYPNKVAMTKAEFEAEGLPSDDRSLRRYYRRALWNAPPDCAIAILCNESELLNCESRLRGAQRQLAEAGLFIVDEWSSKKVGASA